MAQQTLRIIPLGGLGEIGKNMMALECDGDIIVIDAGVLFPEEDMPGIDLVIPDISYLVEHMERVRAILITHGHEDHTGALPYVLQQLSVPVYAPRLAHGLISVKLKEHHRLRGTRLHEIEPGTKYKLGRFTAEFFRVCHSIPDAMGVAIRTPLGIVVHTGDFKIDHTPVDGQLTDFRRLAQLASEGIFLLFSDSTYAEAPGYTTSEQVVGEALERVIGEAPGRVIIATFASLISRIQQIIDAAVVHNRKVAIVGRSMVDNVKMTLKMGYLSAPDGTLAPLNEIRHLPHSQAVIITTGSQGEPTSALVRMANHDQRDVRIIPGDTVVVSATPIPGNEALAYKTIDNLCRQGARVLYHRTDLVHVHSHASQEELKMVLNLTSPKFFVPVHGEHRHLRAHASLAQSLGIPASHTFVLEDGDVLELTREGGSVVDQVSAGHIYVDGRRVWDMKSPVLKERKSISRDGILIAIVTLDKSTGEILRPPKLISRGFVDTREANELYPKASKLVAESLNHQKEPGRTWSHIESTVKEALGKFLYQETGRRPMIIPVAVEI